MNRFNVLLFLLLFASSPAQASVCESDDLDVCMKQGVALYKAGQFKEALPFFQEVAAKDANHPKAFHRMANCYERMGDYKLALEYYEKQVEINPQSWNSFYGIGFNNLALGSRDRTNDAWVEAALVGFKQSYDLRPDYEQTSAYLCTIYNKFERYDLCLVQFDTFASQYIVENVDFMKSVLLAAVLGGEVKRRQLYTFKAIQLFPNDYYFNYWAAVDDVEAGRIGEARKRLEFLQSIPKERLYYGIERVLDLEDLEKKINAI